MLIERDKARFLDKCLKILDVRGIASNSLIILGNECTGKVYEDSLIKIMKSDDDQYMEMLRKTSDSIFFHFYKGECIQFHGEYVYLEEHMNTLGNNGK